MKLNLFLLLLLLTVCIACSKKNEHLQEPNHLVFIFDNVPDQSKFVYPSGVTSSSYPFKLISYIDADGILRQYTPCDGLDTLIIGNIKEDYLEIIHKYQGLENIYFLFKTGDTIYFEYDRIRYPKAVGSLSEELTKIYNLNFSIKNRNYKWNFESYTLLTSNHIIRLNEGKNNNPEFYDKVLKRLHVDFIDQDTLLNRFDNFIRNYKYTCDSMGLDDVFLVYHNYLINKKISDIDELIKKRTLIEDKKLDFNDSLLCFISYHFTLFKYLENVSSSEYIDKIKVSNGTLIDYRQVFNFILDEEFPVLTKNQLLYYCLGYIIEDFPADDINKYLIKYLDYSKDTIKYKFSIDENNLEGSRTDLTLERIDESFISFNELLEKHKGKVLYVDFWASWCSPCLSSMPKARLLREEYKNKDVVFIYLAWNDDAVLWEKSVRELEIDYLGENYFITNSKMSKMLEDINLKAIPRYLIYNKKSELVYSNAPGPEGEEIRRLLNNYLNDEKE